MPREERREERPVSASPPDFVPENRLPVGRPPFGAGGAQKTVRDGDGIER